MSLISVGDSDQCIGYLVVKLQKRHNWIYI